MSEVRPGRPGSSPLPRRPQPPPPPRRPVVKPASSQGLWISLGVGAIVLVIAAVAILSGNKTPEPAPVVTKPPVPKVVPKPPPPIQAPPTVPPPVVAPPPAPPKPVADPLEEKKAELARDAKRLREEGAARVEEARKSVEQDLEREKKEAAEFARRFADFRLDARLATGTIYKQALVTGFTADDLQLKTIERDSVTVPWNMVDPASIVAVAGHVYRAQTADDQVALARFLVERRLWKEAQAALNRAKKIDPEHEGMSERFDEAAAPLLTGKGLFQGALKTVGATGIRLSYDFSDIQQGDDFEGREAVKLEGGKMTLESPEKGSRLWRVGDHELEFGDELEFEAKVIAEGSLLVAYYRRGEGEFYVVEAGPAGTFLKKGKSMLKLAELAKNDKAHLKGEQKIRIVVKRRKVTVAIAGKPALSFDDAAGDVETRGQFQIGVTGGKVVFLPTLVAAGQVNPDYLKKKIGTIEMEARRAVSKDLGEVRELNELQMANMILGGSADGISADLLVLQFLTVQDLPEYVKLKRDLIRGGGSEERKALAKTLEEWIGKHGGFPSLWYLRGMLHLREYELGEARDKFAKAIALFPEFHEARYQTAVTWQYAREFEKALEDARAALELRPDYAPGRMLQAEMRFAIDKKAGAESERELRVAEKLEANAAEVLELRRWIKMQTRGPRDLGCIYEHESAHYRIVTDISPERAVWYADQLEIVRGTYMDLFKKWYRGDARPKPRIAIFNTREAFYTYSEFCSTNRHENALGFFDPANNELVLFEDLDLNETLETLYHEAFHHFASSMLKFPPYWWNEGIAEYMSAVRIDPVKKTVKERARTLRGRLQGIQMVLRGQFFVRFEQIINYNPAEFYSPQMIGIHYAQAWAMIHFFYEFQGGKHRPLIEQYFDELLGGKTQRQAFDAVFKGKTDELEKEWKKFTEGLKPPATP